jgi:hypothetical protein
VTVRGAGVGGAEFPDSLLQTLFGAVPGRAVDVEDPLLQTAAARTLAAAAKAAATVEVAALLLLLDPLLVRI